MQAALHAAAQPLVLEPLWFGLWGQGRRAAARHVPGVPICYFGTSESRCGLGSGLLAGHASSFQCCYRGSEAGQFWLGLWDRDAVQLLNLEQVCLSSTFPVMVCRSPEPRCRYGSRLLLVVQAEPSAAAELAVPG